jgi:hypothetical protein
MSPVRRWINIGGGLALLALLSYGIWSAHVDGGRMRGSPSAERPLGLDLGVRD